MGICLATAFVLSMRSCAVDADIDADAVEASVEAASTEGLARSTDLVISQQALEHEAEDRLIAYRQEDGCTLECAGYLDLFGNTWGCVVRGDGWVEILVIRDVSETTCSVQTITLSADG